MSKEEALLRRYFPGLADKLCVVTQQSASTGTQGVKIWTIGAVCLKRFRFVEIPEFWVAEESCLFATVYGGHYATAEETVKNLVDKMELIIKNYNKLLRLVPGKEYAET